MQSFQFLQMMALELSFDEIELGSFVYINL